MSWTPNKSKRLDPVQMLVVHWSGGTYKSALDWCMRDESDVSYHYLIGRVEGEEVQLCPWDYAAWAVGPARPPIGSRLVWTRGNHSTENIALSGGPPTPPTDFQVVRLTRVLAGRMKANGWTERDVGVRITDHYAVRKAAIAAGVTRATNTKPDIGTSGWLDLDALRSNVALVMRAGLD